MPKQEVQRLPKWAQLEIEALRHRVQFLEHAASPDPKSNTTCGIELLGTKRDLPHESPVQFHMNRKTGRYLEASVCNGRLNVAASQAITVRQIAKNCVQVRIAN